MNKKEYKEPIIDLVSINNVDVICSSGDDLLAPWDDNWNLNL